MAWSDSRAGVRIVGRGLLLALVVGCGGPSAVDVPSSSPSSETGTPEIETATPGSGDTGSTGPGAFAWNDYVGAHYTPRDWARGGLRDAGGPSGYRPDAKGADEGLASFESKTLPLLAELLGAGQYAVLQAGGPTSDGPFFELVQTVEGRTAFADALTARVDRIHALPDADDWPSHVVFQFGNEIQNPERFYGGVCQWATGGATSTCDLETEFAPVYVDQYLAPGIEALRARSTELFGRPDAIRVGLGSVVDLSARRAFVEALLEYEIEGTFAPSLAGRAVYELVDTVTIHYTMNTGAGPTRVDDFFGTWTSRPGSAVRALWLTEEVGIRAAQSGLGLAAVLRAIAPTLHWTAERQLSPEQAHLFVWGADADCVDQGPDCLSIDDAMPAFADFAGARPLVERSGTTAEASVPLSLYTFDAGPDRRIVLAWAPGASTPVVVSGLTVDRTGWASDEVEATLRQVGPAGLAPVAVAQDGDTFVFSAALEPREVLWLALERRPASR